MSTTELFEDDVEDEEEAVSETEAEDEAPEEEEPELAADAEEEPEEEPDDGRKRERAGLTNEARKQRQRAQEAERAAAEAAKQEQERERRLQALEEENRRLREAEQAKPKAPPPKPTDPLDDPDKFRQEILHEAEMRTAARVFRASEKRALQNHSREALQEAQEAYFKAAETSPGMAQDLMQDDDPYETVVAWHERQKALAEIGDDPASYKAKLKEELKKELLAEMNGDEGDEPDDADLEDDDAEEASGAESAPEKPKVPRSLNGRGSGGRARRREEVPRMESTTELFEGPI